MSDLQNSPGADVVGKPKLSKAEEFKLRLEQEKQRKEQEIAQAKAERMAAIKVVKELGKDATKEREEEKKNEIAKKENDLTESQRRAKEALDARKKAEENVQSTRAAPLEENAKNHVVVQEQVQNVANTQEENQSFHHQQDEVEQQQEQAAYHVEEQQQHVVNEVEQDIKASEEEQIGQKEDVDNAIPSNDEQNNNIETVQDVSHQEEVNNIKSNEDTSANNADESNDSGAVEAHVEQGQEVQTTSAVEQEQQQQADATPTLFVATALHDFAGEADTDLSFNTGDQIEVLERVDENWWRGRIGAREGIFPFTFIDAPQEHGGAPAAVQEHQGSGDIRTATCDFSGESEDDLPFAQGDKITVVEILDENWIMGQLGDRKGLVPIAYLA